MEFGINVRFFEKELGLKRAAELVARAGFTALDYTPPIRQDDWEYQMKEALKIFDANGLSVHQIHMPFNRYGRHGNMHRTYLDRCADAAEFMGAKFIVAHGDEFDFEHLEFSPEAALSYNHEYFRTYVERAEKSGCKMAFETVYEDWDRRRFTSKADELKELILSFDSDSAVCCWDFGHGNVSFKKDAPSVIREFGSLIQCTHLHDNTGKDSHQMPMTGSIVWKDTIDAFKDIGYSGVMSVEYSAGSLPGCLLEDFINLTYKAAKYVWEL